MYGSVQGRARWCNLATDEVNPLDCLKLTKSTQKVADTLQSVADLFDDHARRTQLVTHEALKGVSHPYATYAVRRSCYNRAQAAETPLSLLLILTFPL